MGSTDFAVEYKSARVAFRHLSMDQMEQWVRPNP
jgi:hypothetical protein